MESEKSTSPKKETLTAAVMETLTAAVMETSMVTETLRAATEKVAETQIGRAHV